MLRFIAPLILIAFAFGCQDKPTEGAPTATPKAGAKAGPKTDPALLKRLDALGDGGLLIGVLDGRGWGKVYQRLAPVIAKLPAPAPTEIAPIATLPGLLNTLYKGLFRGKTPLDLSALDAKGAVVISLFEPAIFGPPGAIGARPRFDNHQVPLRHELVLPATDSTALAAAVLAGLKASCEPAAHGCDFGELQVGVKTQGDVVRIAALMPATVEDAKTMLWRTPQAPSARTSAYTQLAAPGAAASLLIRPWRIRAMHMQDSFNDITVALNSFDGRPETRQTLFAKGASLVLGAARMMHAERPDLEDAVLRLVPDDAGVALEGTHALTAATAKALKTAAAQGGHTLALKVPVLAQMAQSTDLNALLDGVGPRPLFARTKHIQEFVRGIGECGFGCTLHTAFRVPFSTARGALDLAPAQVKTIVRSLPTAMQAALVRLDERAKPVAALAGEVAKDFDTGQLRALPGAEVHMVPKNDRALLLVGIGIDPRTVFDVQAATKTTATSTARVEPATFDKLARVLGAGPMTPVFNALGPLVAESAIAPGGHAFAWRIHFNTSPGVTASAFAPATSTPTANPIVGFTPGTGDRCLADLTQGMAALLSSFPELSPNDRVPALAKGLAKIEPHFNCAESNPATKTASLGMRRLLVSTLSMGADQGRTDYLMFIQAQCSATKDTWLCAEAKRIEELPPPAAPASVDTSNQPVTPVPPAVPSVGLATFALEDIPQKLDKASIQKVIRAKVNQAKYCYEKSLVKNPKLAGKAMVSFTIAPTGVIKDVSSAGADLPAEVHACLTKRVERWRFPVAMTPTKVNYPFIFSPK